jgi:hypothetical protein
MAAEGITAAAVTTVVVATTAEAASTVAVVGTAVADTGNRSWEEHNERLAAKAAGRFCFPATRNESAPGRISQSTSPINLYRRLHFLLECAVAETPLSL